MAKFDAGKWAEREVQNWLEEASQQSSDFAYHRFPDARAARGALAAQPSDFLVSAATWGGGNRVVFLEVKETAQERRLPKAKISQYGMLKKFFWTGADVLVLVYMSAIKKWVMLKGSNFENQDDLFHYDDCPPSFPLTGLTTYDTAAQALKEFFED